MSQEIQPAGKSLFDTIRHTDENGEYWTARELMSILGYSTWQRFAEGPIAKAKEDCEKSGRLASEHFNIFVKTPENGGPATDDYKLTAYACRLIVMASRTRNKTSVVDKG